MTRDSARPEALIGHTRDGIPVYRDNSFSSEDLDEIVHDFSLGWTPRWKVGRTGILAETVMNHALAEGHAQSYGYLDNPLEAVPDPDHDED